MRERLEEIRARGDPELSPLWIEGLDARRAHKEVLDRDGAVFRLQEARILGELGRREEARQILTGLQELPGGLADVRADLLRGLGEAGPEPDALDMGPASLASKTLAELYAAQGNLEEALAIYRDVVGREPGDEKARRRARELSGHGEAELEPEGLTSELEHWLGRVRAWRKDQRG